MNMCLRPGQGTDHLSILAKRAAGWKEDSERRGCAARRWRGSTADGANPRAAHRLLERVGWNGGRGESRTAGVGAIAV